VKTFLLVLFAVALALVVYWLARAEPLASHDAAIALPREIDDAQSSNVQLASSLDKAAAASARSRVSESSVSPAARRPPEHSNDTGPLQNGSVYGRALARSARGPEAAVGKLSLVHESPPPDEWTPLTQQMRPVGSLELDPNGEFDIGHLALGTWSVGCHVPGCVTAEARIVLSREKPRVRIDFELVPQRLVRITLHDVDGRPLISNLSRAGSKVGGFLGAFASDVQPTVGEPPLANGGALVSRMHIVDRGDADPWCEIEIDRQDPFWVCVAIGDRTLAVHDVQPGEEEVTSVVPKDRVLGALGSVDVTVVDDSTSLALESALVSFRVSEAPTDAHGSVRFDGLLPGELRISAVAKEYVVRSVTAAISPGTVTRSEIRLETSVTISGILKNAAGERIGGNVEIIPLSGDRSLIQSARAQADGSFVRMGLAHGEYLVVDSGSHVSPNAAALLDKNSLQEGMVYVDARAGPISNIVVVAHRTDRNKVIAPR
jgi:hypothetical protein